MGRRFHMRIEFQKCRTWGHAWEDFIPAQGSKRTAPWGRRFSLRCERCHTERHDIFDSLGQLSTRSYDYPGDYQLAADDRPEMTQLRLSLVRELREQASARDEKRQSRNGARGKPRKAARRGATPVRRRLAAVS